MSVSYSNMHYLFQFRNNKILAKNYWAKQYHNCWCQEHCEEYNTDQLHLDVNFLALPPAKKTHAIVQQREYKNDVEQGYWEVVNHQCSSDDCVYEPVVAFEHCEAILSKEEVVIDQQKD